MRGSANHDMGTELYHTFVEAGLPEPTMRMELPLGRNPTWHNGITIPYAVATADGAVASAIESLGSLDTLVQRLQDEVAESKTVACWFASVGAWCRKA
jgi:hypothetical protein